MAGSKSGVDKLLDISGITSSRGFIVSSSDEEDNVAELGRSSHAVGNRLASIFGVPTRKSPAPEASEAGTSAPNRTMFASKALLFAPDAEGRMEKKFPVGAAVLSHNGQWALIVYNSQKQRIATFLLSPGSLNISTQCSSGSFLMISSTTSSIALFFSDAETEALKTLTTLIVILAGIDTCDLILGSGDPCTQGNHVLFDAVKISIGDEDIEKSEIAEEKAKLAEKAPQWIRKIRGMARGGSRIVRESETAAYVVILRKIRDKTRSSTVSKCPSESESVDQMDPIVPAVELSDVEADAQQLEERTNDVLSRVAKLGRAVIPAFAQPMEPVKPESDPCPSDEPTPPIPESQPNHTNSPPDYAAFHQVVGTEVDRLEIRLEAAVQRMIDRSLQPILDEVKSISTAQQKILEELRLLRQ